MELAFNRKVTVRDNPTKAAGTDNSRFESDNTLEKMVGESIANIDPALLVELMDYLEKTK